MKQEQLNKMIKCHNIISMRILTNGRKRKQIYQIMI